jgi:hypothetical protein
MRVDEGLQFDALWPALNAMITRMLRPSAPPTIKNPVSP